MNEETKVQNGENKPIFQKKKKKWEFTPKNFFFSFLWLAPLCIMIDQITKWAVVNAYDGVAGTTTTVIPNFFFITLTYNLGSSFSFGADVPWMRFVFIAISWLASAGILYFWIKNLNKNDTWIDVVFALCLGGALGNAIDRSFYWNETVGFSGVVDFLHFRFFGSYDFAIFNFADSCLTVGIALLLVIMVVREIADRKKIKA